MRVRDRIKELRRVKASELLPNPKNWRTHPDAQRTVMRAVLEEVGIADAVLARETPEGLMLIDGHLRAETITDVEIPVLVLDVTEAEADKVLATMDPLAAMAEEDEAKKAELYGSIEAEMADLEHFLDRMLSRKGDDGGEPTEEAGDAPPELALRPHEHYDYVVVLARDSSTWNVLCQRLGITRRPLGGDRRKSRLGICRAIAAEVLLERLSDHHPEPRPSEGGPEVQATPAGGNGDGRGRRTRGVPAG